MDKVAKLPIKDRNELFNETANNLGVATRIVEKDFWVCWTLKKLFSIPEIGPQLIFKGGTSLSKVYGIIQRFSEDIDVTISKTALGFSGEDEFRGLSNKQRKDKIDALFLECSKKVQGEIQTALDESFSSHLGEAGTNNWRLEVDLSEEYPQTLLFSYPREIKQANDPLEYVRPIVKIEMGARAYNYPAEEHLITPYAAEEFPALFDDPSYSLLVLAAERTFWEKATILHDLFHREDSYQTADRVSRHYYDLFKMTEAGIVERALKNRELLESVVENKLLFFYRAGAQYEEAINGNLRLVPSDARLSALRRDYEKMNPMFFSSPPAFEEIVDTLRHLEEQINSVA